MRYISENKQPLNAPEYFSTDNPDIILELKTVSAEIHLDKLQKQIDNLNTQIEAVPEMLEYPKGASNEVREAIDMFNEMQDGVGKQELIVERDEQQALLDKLKAL